MAQAREDRLREIVAMVLDVPAARVGPGLDFTTLAAWSSLQHMMLVSQIEHEFEVNLTNEQMRSMTTWDRACELVGGDSG